MEGKKITLHYFAGNGRGLLPRALLKYGKINFEDKQYSFPEFNEKKNTFDFKFLPVLEIDNEQLNQSHAINIYLARKIGGLLGKTPEEEQAILTAEFSYDDIANKQFQYEFKKIDENVAKEQLVNTTIQIVSGLEAVHKKHGGKYFVGDSISLADFVLATYFSTYLFSLRKDLLREKIEQAAPLLTKLVDRLISEEPFNSLIKEVAIIGSF